jgi:hypothetical protein
MPSIIRRLTNLFPGTSDLKLCKVSSMSCTTHDLLCPLFKSPFELKPPRPSLLDGAKVRPRAGVKKLEKRVTAAPVQRVDMRA